MRGAKKRGFLRKSRLAVVSHLCKLNPFDVCLKITQFSKLWLSTRMRSAPKKRVPEEIKIGRSFTPLQMESI